MKLSTSQPLCDADDIFHQWDVTSEVIVVLLINRETSTSTLQVRDWDGKQLWQITLAEIAPWGVAIGENSIFLGSGSGAVREFDLSSGYEYPITPIPLESLTVFAGRLLMSTPSMRALHIQFAQREIPAVPCSL